MWPINDHCNALWFNIALDHTSWHISILINTHKLSISSYKCRQTIVYFIDFPVHCTRHGMSLVMTICNETHLKPIKLIDHLLVLSFNQSSLRGQNARSHLIILALEHGCRQRCGHNNDWWWWAVDWSPVRLVTMICL